MKKIFLYLLLIFIILFSKSFTAPVKFKYKKDILPTGKIKTDTLKRKYWGVALSGGGARGFAHLGFLKALQEEGLEPDMITGTSMGAVIGGFLASGYEMNEIIELMNSVDFTAIFSNDPGREDVIMQNKNYYDLFMGSLNITKKGLELPRSILSGYKIQKLFFKYLSPITTINKFNDFNNLYYPMRVVSTDIKTGEEYVFKKGDLGIAVRSSMNIPGVFPPIRIDKHKLVDGGISNNLPISELENMGVNFMVGVDISKSPSTDVTTVLETLNQLTTIFIYNQTKKSYQKAHKVFNIPLGDIKSSDFDKYKQIYKEGYKYGKKHAKKLNKDLKLKEQKYYIENIIYNNKKFKIKDYLCESNIYKKIENIISTENLWEFRAELVGESLYIKDYTIIESIKIKSPDKSISFQTESLTNTKKLLKKIKNIEYKDGYRATLVCDCSVVDKTLYLKTRNLAVDGIKVLNNEYFSDRFIKKYFQRNEQIYFDKKLLQSLDRLYGTGFFEVVLPYFENVDGKTNLVIYVNEKNRAKLSLAGNFIAGKGFKTYSRVDYNNVIGWNGMLTHELVLDKDRHGRITYFSPLFFDLPVRFKIGAGYYEESDFPGDKYTQKKYYGFTGFNLIKYISGLKVNFSYQEYKPMYSDYVNYYKSKAEIDIENINSSNLKLDGYRFHASYEKPLSELNYSKYVVEHEHYFNIKNFVSFYTDLFWGKLAGTDFVYNNRIKYDNIFDLDDYSYYEDIMDIKSGLKYLNNKNIFVPYIFCGYLTKNRIEDGKIYYGLGVEKRVVLLRYIRWEIGFSKKKQQIYFQIGVNLNNL